PPRGHACPHGTGRRARARRGLRSRPLARDSRRPLRGRRRPLRDARFTHERTDLVTVSPLRRGKTGGGVNEGYARIGHPGRSPPPPASPPPPPPAAARARAPAFTPRPAFPLDLRGAAADVAFCATLDTLTNARTW